MIADFLRRNPGLLVSVRSPAEVEAAIAGGADLIDVKEPANGSLGVNRALPEIARQVAGRKPVSAAVGELGELRDSPAELLSWAAEAGAQLVKVGLAGCQARETWRAELAGIVSMETKRSGSAQLVVAAYADWERAEAPRVEDVAAFARQARCGFLIDTWLKDGTTLLDWLDAEEIGKLCHEFRRAELPIALAGSLGVDEIRRLRAARPDWFAVRGSVCDGGRGGEVNAELVRRIKVEFGEEQS